MYKNFNQITHFAYLFLIYGPLTLHLHLIHFLHDILT